MFRFVAAGLALLALVGGAEAQVRPSSPVPSKTYVDNKVGEVGARVTQLLLDLGSVQAYGAVCDGVTDDGPAFQRALDARRAVLVPVAGCTGPYRIETPLNVAANKSLAGVAPGRTISQVVQPSVSVILVAGQAPTSTAGIVTDETGPGSIVTRNSIDTIVTSGGGVTLTNLNIAHFGSSGSAVRSPGGTYFNLTNSKVAGYNPASTTPLVYIAGSSFNVEANLITNSRAKSAPAIEVERTTAGIVIESYIHRNQLDGRWIDTSNPVQAQVYSGSGIHIFSSVTGSRPEGIHVISNSIVTKGDYQYLANRGLLLKIQQNVFDVGRARSVIFDPDGIGIDSVTVTGNWLAGENNGGFVNPDGSITAGYGKCLEFANDTNVATGASSGIANINVSNNQFHFCSHGVVGSSAVNGLTVTANNFVSMSTWAAQFVSANRVVFSDNVMANIGAGKYLFASDGPGGPYIITGNTFSGGATSTLDLARADVTRFIVDNNHGVTNTSVRDQTHRVALTTAGFTVPSSNGIAGVASVMMIPATTISSTTVTLPVGGYTGQPLVINNGAFPVTAFNFSPAVNGWTNGTQLDAYASISMRWDNTLAAWVAYATSSVQTLPYQYDVMTTTGTWTKPTWAKEVTFITVGGGGGGGSGRRGAAASVRTGGGGGGVGGLTMETYSGAEVPATVGLDIGAGGTGGPAATADNTNGSNGGLGGDTRVTFSGTIVVQAKGGSGGLAGSTVAASGGLAGTQISFDPAPQGNGGASSGTGANGGGGVNGIRAGAGAGAGGGITSADVFGNGGASGFGYLIGGNRFTNSSAGGATAGANGTAGVVKGWTRGFGGSGGGGAGGNAAGTVAGGTGGLGNAAGGAGGGGGASTNGANSGAGGDGGRGEIWIITRN